MMTVEFITALFYEGVFCPKRRKGIIQRFRLSSPSS